MLMIKTLKLIFISMTLVCSPAVAGPVVWDKDFSISDTKAIKVFLDDNAKGACWTNLRETREYAEEKVRMLGGKIDDFVLPLAPERKYELNIFVHLQRYFVDDTGPCYGNIRIALKTFAQVDTFFHSSEIAHFEAVLLDPNNLNKETINAISIFFSALR